MIRLRPPTHRVRDVFQKCCSGYVQQRTRDRRDRLRLSEGDVEDLASSYDALAETQGLQSLKAHTELGSASKDDYLDLYETKFVGKAGRDYYNEIFASTLVCPYCRKGEISALDHFLPKDDFPGLSVHTRNLLPCCYPCNKKKGMRNHSQTGVVPLHPYFETPPKGWLACEVIEGPMVNPTFSLAPGLPVDLQVRVQEHMNAYHLAERFGVYASSDLVDSKAYLLELGDQNGPPGVRAHCAEEAARIAYDDSWRKRLYECLSASDWFCAVGYTLIDG